MILSVDMSNVNCFTFNLILISMLLDHLASPFEIRWLYTHRLQKSI